MLRRKKIILMLTIITLAITNLNIVNAESNAFVSQKSEELWLQDIQEYEIKMGKIVDEI